MTIGELVAQFRTDSRDLAEPYLSATADVERWLNEAESEAAIRKSLLHEADDADVCRIAVTAGTARYPLHQAVIVVTRATFTPAGSTCVIDLNLTDRIEQDRTRSGWRRRTEEPRAVMQEDAFIQLACLPSTDGILEIECYRLPMDCEKQGADELEIGPIHHRHLVQWALYRAYSVPDADLSNPGAAAAALAAFTDYFGIRPDADLRRVFAANLPMHNKAIW